MFQSVGLNVNNPHFLIMQGRITKVLNMKPPEILGLIEEAAGTRMFEAKKVSAQKTIEKKQGKVEELSKVLEEEITPQLKKLQEERANYLRWAANNTELERLAKFKVAYEYTLAERSVAGSGARMGELGTEAGTLAATGRRWRACAAERDAEGTAAAARVAAARGGELASLIEASSSATREAASATSSLKHAEKALGEEERGRAAAAKASSEGERSIGELERALERYLSDGARVGAALAEAEAGTKALQAKLTAVTAGMRGEEGGSGDSSSTSTAADALISAKAELKTVGAEAAGREMRVKEMKKRSAEASAALKAAEKDARGLQTSLEAARAGLDSKRVQLASLKYDAGGGEILASRRDALAAAAAGESEKLEEAWASLLPTVEFRYEEAGMGKGWDAATRVKGTLAQLVRLLRPAAAKALEVAAGGRLFGVVVDTEDTAAALISRGGLKRRWEFYPLSQLKTRILAPEQVAAAASLVPGGGAVPALSLLRPTSPECARALEYVWGNVFICDTPAIAQAVCYDKRIQARCITLEGDIFDPRGLVEGGSDVGGSGGPATLPLLARLEECHSANDRLIGLRRELGECEGTLAAMSSALRAHKTITEECVCVCARASLK